MAMDYEDWSKEEEDEPYEEPPLDESVLTPEQQVKLDELCKENPTLTRRDLAGFLRLNLISHRASLEGRELTFDEIRVAHALEEVIYWVPPTQLEGTYDSSFEFHDDEDSHMPCNEDTTSSLDTLMLIDDCYDLICETQRLDTLRVEKLARDYHEASFDINYLCASSIHDLEFSISMLEESGLFLEKSYLRDMVDIDDLLNKIEDPKVKIDSRNENFVFDMIDGDEVNYFVKNSSKPEVDFIFPSNAFDLHEHLTMEDSKIYTTFSLDESCISFSWKCLLAYFVHFLNRRRTKGALAQPFDSHD